MSHKKSTRVGKGISLMLLPLEILLLINEFLELEDIRAMSITCSYMSSALDSMLYKRAIDTGVYKQKFLYATCWGRAAAISKFLKGGVSMTEFSSHIYSGFSWYYSDISCAKRAALTLCRNPGRPEFHPLLAAANFGYVDVTRTLLIEGNANVNFEDGCRNTALFYTIRNDHLDVTRILLDQGAKLTDDENGHDKSPFIYAANFGNKDALEMMYNELQNRSLSKNAILDLCQKACFSAFAGGFTEIVEYFLYKGVDVNHYFWDKRVEGSLLHHASIRCDFPMMKLLVKHGARMENDKDTGAISVFRVRSKESAKEVVRQLLKFGCNVANGGRHACALWRIAQGYSQLDPDRTLIELLQKHGFDKEKCQDECWIKNRYRFRGDGLFSEKFYNYVKG